MSKEQPRRKDRILSDKNVIDELLETGRSATFGFVDNGRPYLNSNLFIFSREENVIYFHTAGQGRVNDIVRANSSASFLLHQVGRFLPSKHALELSVEYISIYIEGTVTLVNDEGSVMRIFGQYISKHFPSIDLHALVGFGPSDARKATMFKLSIESLTAKRHEESAEYPGAFEFNDNYFKK
jgi:nitroimidazol reductase NimA-like FMN-containing flavoprotein (pyridoxamine 5'-phosphate oxidase superfamily)